MRRVESASSHVGRWSHRSRWRSNGVKCPFCSHDEDKVVDSRASSDGIAIRRRRECLKCGKRFTTYEHVEEQALMVIKKDGRREPFDRHKLLAGLLKACEKRPVSMDQLENLVDELERELSQHFDPPGPPPGGGGGGGGRGP